MDMTKIVETFISGQVQSHTKLKATKATFSNIQRLEKYLTKTR